MLEILGMKKFFCLRCSWITIGAIVLAAITLPYQMLHAENEVKFEFTSVEADKAKFVGYLNSIKLPPDKELVKKEVLSSISSPCCEKHTAYNCCSCEVAQSVLGLSNYLIASLNYDAQSAKKTVEQWIEQVEFGHASCGGKGDACCQEQSGTSCEPSKLEEIVESCRIPGL